MGSIGECCSGTGMGISAFSTLALAVTGVIAGLGILPGGTFGWISVGLGGGITLLGTGAFAYEFHQDQGSSDNVLPLVLTPLIGAGFVTLGGLGVAGILSGSFVAWIVAAIAAGTFGTICIVGTRAFCCDLSNANL